MDSTLVPSFEETMEVQVQEKEEPTKVQKEAKEENEFLLDLEEKDVESNPNLEHYDGLVLLNSIADGPVEKTATLNLSLSGFDVIDDIKATVEEKYPKVHGMPLGMVLTGTRDGNIPNAPTTRLVKPLLLRWILRAPSFNSHYYIILEQNEVLFTSDATLLTNVKSKRIT
ncbi:hypothetical protein Cgig2_021451 [Carnegiea gigantea]|uniref:Uncharacterized protein n=1 Tax=Carnegiea gigantea TaxID=171969 RepID=A0A9Q1K0G5_9CARY|nr:hypothetical protein Cgig2_021451 [Carnegiea gigantea]